MDKTRRRTALVTGASGGFGRLICLELARKGFYVIGTIRDETKKGALLEAAKRLGVGERVETVPLDVAREDAGDIVAAVMKKIGTLDVLVNNAGYASGGFTEDIPMDEWIKQFETNVFGLIRVTKAVLPYMREAGRGTIINMSSISGRIAFPGLGPYAASKFAVEGFSEALRLEMQPYGVHVVLVEPGSYKTEIWAKGLAAFRADPGSPYGDKTERLLERVRHTANTAGPPEEVAKIVVRIALEEKPRFRYPIGRGVKTALILKRIMPWRWIERAILKRMS